MKHLLIFVVIFLATFVVAGLIGKFDLGNVAGRLKSALKEIETVEDREFESTILAAANAKRDKAGVKDLTSDPEVESSLTRYVAANQSLSDISDVNALQKYLQSELTDADSLAAAVLIDLNLAGIQEKLAQWPELESGKYKTASTILLRDQLRYGCVVALASRLPTIDIQTPFTNVRRFYDACPICDNGHAVEINRYGVLQLSCPRCGNNYDVLAADTIGRIRPASHFFQASESLPTVPINGLDLERMRKILQLVLLRCEYQQDTSGFNRGDVWKTADETWNDRGGDCEDTSILLATMLSRAAIDARVAVGWADGRHAWCVARIGDAQFVLESTQNLAPGKSPDLLPVSEAAEKFYPQYLFDTNRLYFRNDKGSDRKPCTDYWSEQDWVTVTPAPRS